MTYDRYLVKGFLYTLCVCFISTFGLYAVIDLFENLDEYVKINKNNQGMDQGTINLMCLIARLNGYRAVLFFDRAGPALIVISIITVLILLQRSGELHPLLAAGIPMYRILRPMILAGASVNAFLMLNQELLVPRFSFLEHELRNRNDASQSEVESVTDLSNGITIYGAHVNVAEQTIDHPGLILPAPGIVKDLTNIEAEKARFIPPAKNRPAGLFLQNVTSPPIQDLYDKLTAEGREIVIVKKSNDVFVVSAITVDQVFKRSSSYTSLSTMALLDRIRSPAVGMVSVKRLVLFLHSRFVQPLLNIIAVLVTIPLIVRRESPGLVADSTLCLLVLALLFGLTHGFQSLGASQVVSPELAAWAPVVVGGSVAAWLSGVIRT